MARAPLEPVAEMHVADAQGEAADGEGEVEDVEHVRSFARVALRILPGT
jgi:hypothetical protein